MKICSIDTCHEPVKAKLLCNAHYGRVRHGRPMDAPIQRHDSGACVVEGCSASARARSLCGKHYQRVRKYGDPDHDGRVGRRQGGCEVPDCDRPAQSKNLCAMHYLRKWKTGSTDDPEPRRGPYIPLEDRFARFTEAGEGGCLIWTGNRDRFGYGCIRIAGRNVRAHRVAWEMCNGAPFPDGLQADHLCNVTSCVNPEHIEPVTAQVNSQRRDERRRVKTGGAPVPQAA